MTFRLKTSLFIARVIGTIGLIISLIGWYVLIEGYMMGQITSHVSSGTVALLLSGASGTIVATVLLWYEIEGGCEVKVERNNSL